MSNTRFCLLISAIYLAPHNSPWVGIGLGCVFAVVALAEMGKK